MVLSSHNTSMLVPTRTIPRRLAAAGWILYAASWVTPSLHDGIGARAFLSSLEYAMRFSRHPQSWAGFVLGQCLLFGWLANFSLFMRLSSRARIVWVAAPWFPFLGALLLADAPAPVREHVFSLLYFYPWAIGIACIHIAKMRDGGSAWPSSARV
jgi:hypothetical protein